VTVPHDHGLLDVGDGQHVHWECCGNPDGTPVLMVHGGPGSGCTPAMRHVVDPTRHRLILFDQRGCGRSRPHVADPTTDLTTNTTHHLVADVERLRRHLGVARWLLTGGSWGSTLILAYAQRHPERVSGVVIRGVTTTSRRELRWLYRGAGRFFPAEQERFRAHVPEASEDLFGDGGVLAAYARRCSSPDPDVSERAAAQWCAWEDALIAHESTGRPGAYSDRPPQDRLALVRICAHYFAHAAWLEEDELLHRAARLAGIPAVLLHGRLDLSSPLETAWLLARAWPGAELVVVEDAGHTGTPSMREPLRQAYDDVVDRAARADR
jgi:proline iminopeptidase